MQFTSLKVWCHLAFIAGTQRGSHKNVEPMACCRVESRSVTTWYTYMLSGDSNSSKAGVSSTPTNKRWTFVRLLPSLNTPFALACRHSWTHDARTLHVVSCDTCDIRKNCRTCCMDVSSGWRLRVVSNKPCNKLWPPSRHLQTNPV